MSRLRTTVTGARFYGLPSVGGLGRGAKRPMTAWLAPSCSHGPYNVAEALLIPQFEQDLSDYALKSYVDSAVANKDVGVTTFNGRKGAVSPQSGDYTYSMVGAASSGHGHSGTYADYSHTHNYAAASHTHSYASTSHSHSEYASSSHTHSGYASSTHTHSYASSSHTHSGYASSSHTHSASDITGLSSGGNVTVKTINVNDVITNKEFSATGSNNYISYDTYLPMNLSSAVVYDLTLKNFKVTAPSDGSGLSLTVMNSPSVTIQSAFYKISGFSASDFQKTSISSIKISFVFNPIWLTNANMSSFQTNNAIRSYFSVNYTPSYSVSPSSTSKIKVSYTLTGTIKYAVIEL